MSGKKSVDEIWKELNARPAPRPASTRGPTPAVASRPTASSQPVKADADAPASDARPPSQPGNRNASEDRARPAPHPTAAAAALPFDPSSAEGTPEQRDEYTKRIQRDINCLAEADRAVRRNAAQRLATRLLKGDSLVPRPSPALLQAVMCGALMTPLTRLLSDQVEKCRECAVEILAGALAVVPDVGPVLPAAFPALTHRVGVLPVAEGAEEVRLMAMKLVQGPVMTRAGPLLLADYVPDISKVLCRGLEDPYHEVKKLASQAVSDLCALPPSDPLQRALEKEAEPLVKAALAAAAHQHSRVRQGAVVALGAVLGRVPIPQALFEGVVGQGLRQLALDPTAPVRQATYAVLGQLLAQVPPAGRTDGAAVPDQASQAQLLLPLLVLGLTDEAAELQREALGHLEEAGAQWASREGPGASAAAAEAGPTEAEVAAAQLPHPFTGPPSRALVSFVRSLLPRVLPPILKDLREWTVGHRAAAARALQSLVIIAGSGAAPHLDTLIPCLCGAMSDDDPVVAGLALGAVHVVGAFLPSTDWLPLAMDAACGARPAPALRASSLVVLSGLLHASARAGHALSPSAIAPLCEGLASEDVRGCDHPGVRMQLVAAITNTVAAGGSLCAPSAAPLLQTLLQLVAREGEPKVVQGARHALSSLAAACGAASPEAFVGQHTRTILERILPGHEAWTAASGAVSSLGSLLKSTSRDALRESLPAVLPVLSSILVDHERDPAMRLELLRTIDALLEDRERNAALRGAAAEALVIGVLLPACVWRVGKVAAAVRFSACVALGTILRNRLLSPEGMMRSLAMTEYLPVLMQLLEEDYYADTRAAACHVTERLLEGAGALMSEDQKRKIYPELLKRLDDSSDSVRIAVAGSLRAFCEHALPTYDDTNAGYLLSGMLIHMDDGNREVQEAVCEAAQAAAYSKPAVAKAEVTKVKDKHRSPVFCDRVLEVAEGGIRIGRGSGQGSGAAAVDRMSIDS